MTRAPTKVRWLAGVAITAAASAVTGAAAHAKAPADAPARHCCATNAHAPADPPRVEKTSARYRIPDVPMVRSDGAAVRARREIDDGRPVVLNFIFTTCVAVCPVMSQSFARVQRLLGDRHPEVHMVSISIDPEEDTPARLTDYARRFGAGPRWSFYTGTVEASLTFQRAFDFYRGDKMNHLPATFVRVAPGQPWVRLEGFAEPEEVVSALHLSSSGE